MISLQVRFFCPVIESCIPGLIMFAGVLDVPTNGVKINGFPNFKMPEIYMLQTTRL